MIRHSTKLHKPQYRKVVTERKDRLQKMLNLDAPEVVVLMMAEQYLNSFRVSWRWTLHDLKMHWFPEWLLWLTDQDYRQACAEPLDPEFEEAVRELAAAQKKAGSR